MKKGICTYTLIPVRKEPSETSEMITQILFGETFSVIESTSKWSWVELDYDGYKGWIDKKLILPISESQINSESKTSDKLLSTAREEGHEGLIYLTLGSNLPNLNAGLKFSIEHLHYELSYPLAAPSNSNKNEIIAYTALQLLNIPYLWGGRSTFGIDCSGLVQTACKLAGIKMFRDAYQQVTQGNTLSFLTEAQTGDLVFFDNEEEKIIHTGILLSQSRIIHACGCVRIDNIDHQGIFDPEKKEYSHKLRTIKRVV
jgi:gamma-D-glutamyl-L-lysine dipeptidyl-peptidase